MPAKKTIQTNNRKAKPQEELTLAEAAKQYGYAPHTLLQAIKRGSLSGHLGKVVIELDAWLVHREDLEDYIANAKKQGKGPQNPRS